MGGFDDLRGVAERLSSVTTNNFELALGPCAIENRSMLELCAAAAKKHGATHLRGGAIKLRTSDTSYSGPGQDGYALLGGVAKNEGLMAVSEVTTVSDVKVAAKFIDLLQIGARCMWHFDLLKAAAASGLPVLLKRGLGASTREWLLTAVRLQNFGCEQIYLCERGLVGVDPAPRNSVDISTLMFLVKEVEIPVWLDVSHSSGDPLVSLSVLSIAQSLGLNGAMAEIHPNPSIAKCDASQAIATEKLFLYKKAT